MNSYPLLRPDGAKTGVWACGSCHRPQAITRGNGEPASESNRERADTCCVPRTCPHCGRPTERGLFGGYDWAHDECIESPRQPPPPPHPTMANPWARLLYRRMSDISEDCYAAGWLIGNEFILWRMLEGDDRDYGMSLVSDEEIEELRTLSERAGGWIWTGRLDAYIPQLVTFERWQELLQEEPEAEI